MNRQFHQDAQGAPDSIAADLSQALGAVRFPANKDSIVESATATGASNEIISWLNGIDDADYDSIDAVMRHLSS